MRRLLSGFSLILMLLAFFLAFFSFMAAIAWLISNEIWLNLVWVVPLFLGMCWMMGEDYE